MTDSNRPYPEFGELKIPELRPTASGFSELEGALREEFKVLAKNLNAVIAYLREVNQRLGELTAWRDQIERRVQELERNDRNRPPSTT